MPGNKEQILKEYGLSDNEVKIYLANLMLGTAKANEIARKADILRTTSYEVLKSLVAKGLVSHVIKSGVKYFEAADPKILVSVLEERKKKINTILPDLEAIRKSVTEKPSIELYEGKAGLKTILDDIINSKPKEVLTLSSAKIFDVLRFYFPHWIIRRAKAGISTRVMQEKTEFMQELKLKDKKELREMKFVPKDFKVNTLTHIYKNKIAILSLRKEEIIGVIIENKEIVETHRSLFEFLWKNS
jgi:sugar-specific transcriptional regulator TrmB